MESTNYNADVLKYLKQANWQPTKKVEREIIIETYKKNGYPIFEKVIDFLEYFWNTDVRFYNKKNKIPDDDFNFNAIYAMEVEVIERLKNDYEPRIGKALVLIGGAYRGYFVLLMDEDGAVYGAYDSFLVKIANSGYSAISAIINDDDFIEIA